MRKIFFICWQYFFNLSVYSFYLHDFIDFGCLNLTNLIDRWHLLHCIFVHNFVAKVNNRYYYFQYVSPQSEPPASWQPFPPRPPLWTAQLPPPVVSGGRRLATSSSSRGHGVRHTPPSVSSHPIADSPRPRANLHLRDHLCWDRPCQPSVLPIHIRLPQPSTGKVKWYIRIT